GWPLRRAAVPEPRLLTARARAPLDGRRAIDGTSRCQLRCLAGMRTARPRQGLRYLRRHQPPLLAAGASAFFSALPHRALASPMTACWALLLGACWISGTPAFREPIIALKSLGICQ